MLNLVERKNGARKFDFFFSNVNRGLMYILW